MSSAGSASDSDEGLDRSFHMMGKNSKIFNDSIHYHIQLPSLCFKIVNTPEFQRLKCLKQLGLCYFVYPSASHNRFEHCIGTSYLAGKYAKSLRKNQPELMIDDKDILCLYVAGLVHDIGHGPFSHTWEHFMKSYNRDYSHEVMSIRLLDYMIEENGLLEDFYAEGLESQDLTFIKECILGHPLPGNDTFLGREPKKSFLYQIVSNEESKIDVDKFDYLLRDCKQLNLTSAFDYKRVMDNSRVVSVLPSAGCGQSEENDDEKPTMKIVYRKKILDNLDDLFTARFRLHQIAYQHKVTKIIEEMILDGLHAAEPYLEIKGKNGQKYKLSTAYQDLGAFVKLTDSIFDIILHWSDDKCPEATEIFTRIVKRDLYKFWGYISTPPTENEKKVLQAISPNIKLIHTKMNYGKGILNPLRACRFYEKKRPNHIYTHDFPPPKIEEKCFIVYKSTGSGSDTSGGSLVDAKQKFKEWAKTYNYRIHQE